MKNVSLKSAIILAVVGSAAVLGSQFIPATKASDEDWTDRAKARCEEKQGYLAYARKANQPVEEVICLPVIFREKAP